MADGGTEATGRHERRTWTVGGISAVGAAALLVGGALTGSAAVLGEGLHLVAHLGAFTLAGGAYILARRLRVAGRARAARLAPDVAGAANGVVLLALAGELAWISWTHLAAAEPPDFAPAVALAVFGLGLNLLSAAVLRHDHADEAEHGEDVNFRAVYLHVLSDAAVAALAIAGLLLGRLSGARWADPAAGFAGAALVAAFALRLLAACARAVAAERRALTQRGHASSNSRG